MQYVFGRRPWLARATGPLAAARDRRSGSVTADPPDDFAVTTFARKALAIATVAGLSLVFLAISVALASLLLLLVAIGFAILGAVFVHRLLRL